MNDDDDFTMCDAPATKIEFVFGEMVARVTSSQNLSPDFVQTIVNDLRVQVVAGARQLNMAYGDKTEAKHGEADQG